jgi:hypothetical protein
VPWLREARINPDLLDYEAVQRTARWTLKPEFLGAPLVSFLEAQDRLRNGRAKIAGRPELLARLASLTSWDDVLDLAEKQEYFEFSPFTERYTPDRYAQSPPLMDVTTLVYLTDGKAILECWQNLFAYLEHVIALQADRFPIARVVTLAVG